MTNIRSSNVCMRISVSTSQTDCRSWYDWIGGGGDWLPVIETGGAEYDSSSRDDIFRGIKVDYYQGVEMQNGFRGRGMLKDLNQIR